MIENLKYHQKQKKRKEKWMKIDREKKKMVAMNHLKKEDTCCEYSL